MLEVLAGFLIMMIGATAVLSFLIFFVKVNVILAGNMQSKYIAEYFTEELRAVSYLDPLISNDGDNTDLDNFTVPDHAAQDTMGTIIFYRSWNVIENSPISGVKTIKVRIVWEHLNKPHSYEFVTLKGSG